MIGRCHLSEDRSEAIKTLDQHTAGLVIFGNQETRRGIREMLPNLPKPFNEATRELIADHANWGGLFLDIPPETDLKLVVQASDEDSAQTIGRLSKATIEYALRKSPPKISEAFGKTVLSKISPQVTDRQVVVDAKEVLADQEFLKSVIATTNNAASQ